MITLNRLPRANGKDYQVRPNAELICPGCRAPLSEVRTSNGILYRCEKCDGRAVSLGLLRRTFTPESINPLWLHTIHREGTPGRRCPSCGNIMFAVHLSDQASATVEVCRICEFVWFDAGETQSLLPRPLPKQAPQLSQKAREAIALLKVEQLSEQARGADFDSAPPDERWKEIAGFFGMPIEFDTPPRERRPWITWLLCLAIIAASAFAFTDLDATVQRFGLIPAEATRLGGLTFLTSFFLHAGVLHLIGNVYFLFVFGDNVENFLRPLRYLALVVFAAFVGDLAHLASNPHATTPAVGASGGIAGVITFYALALPQIRLGFLLRWGFVWFRWVRLRAWVALLLWIIFQTIGAWEQKAGVSAVSAFAHLGGAAVGLVSWLLWRKQGVVASASAET
jgi:membrane associated rhomboid family serine protease/Zn-finger nucleic acid-binding protein